jgi:hypothetical protein
VGAEPRSPLEARGLILTACAVSSRGASVGEGRVGEGRTEGAVGYKEYLSVGEAAKLLGSTAIPSTTA